MLISQRVQKTSCCCCCCNQCYMKNLKETERLINVSNTVIGGFNNDVIISNNKNRPTTISSPQTFFYNSDGNILFQNNPNMEILFNISDYKGNYLGKVIATGNMVSIDGTNTIDYTQPVTMTMYWSYQTKKGNDEIPFGSVMSLMA